MRQEDSVWSQPEQPKERNVNKRHCSWRSYCDHSTWGLKQAFCSCSPHLWNPIKKLTSLRIQQNFSNILNTETTVHIILEVSENSKFFWPQVLIVVLIAMKSLLSWFSQSYVQKYINFPQRKSTHLKGHTKSSHQQLQQSSFKVSVKTYLQF